MKRPSNWIEYDRAGKVVASRVYHDGGTAPLTAAEVPAIAGRCINEERGVTAHRTVSRGAFEQASLL